MADGSIPREIDPTSIDCYLAYGYVPTPLVDLAGRAASSCPRTRCLWKDGRSKLERYWTLDYTPKRSESLPELEEELRERWSARRCGGG